MLGTVRATVAIPPYGQPRLVGQPSNSQSYTTTTQQSSSSSSWRVQTRPSGGGGPPPAPTPSYGYGPVRSSSLVQHASTVELDRLIDELMNISSTEQVAVITSPGQRSQPHWLTMLKTRIGSGGGTGNAATGTLGSREYRDYRRDYREFERSATTSRLENYVRKMSTDSNASNSVSTWKREYIAPLYGQHAQSQAPPPQPPQSPHQSRSATAYARTYSYTTRPFHSHPARYVEQLSESERRLLEELKAQRMRPQQAPPPPPPPQPAPPPRPPPPSTHNYSGTFSYTQRQRSECTASHVHVCCVVSIFQCRYSNSLRNRH